MSSPRNYEQYRLFTKGIIRFLQSKEYQIGVPTQDIKVDAMLEVQKMIAELLGTFTLGHSLSFLISGGASADAASRALQPYVSLADLIGLKIHNLFVEVVLVIYADAVTPDMLEYRFSQFRELGKPVARLGVHVLGSAKCCIFPLLIYFDKDKFNHKQSLSRLLNKGFEIGSGTVDMVTGAVNVPEKIVKYPFGTSFYFMTRFRNTLYFQLADLENVLSLAKE